MIDKASPDKTNINPSLDVSTEKKQHPWIQRFWPLMLSFILSMIWITICVWWFFDSDKTIARMPLYETGGLMAGASLPLILIWLIALVFLRTDPLRDQRTALIHGLDDLAAPLNKIQNHIDSIVKDLHKEIGHVEAASDIALKRIDNLERRFQEQISNLFEVTTNAEAKAIHIQEALSSEREAFTQLITEVATNTAELEKSFNNMKSDSENLTNSTKKTSELINNELIFQNKTLNERSKTIENQLEKMSHLLSDMSQEISNNCTISADKLGHMSEVLIEKQTLLTQNITTLSADTDDICTKMNNQSKYLTELTQKCANDSEKITLTLTEQANNLSSVASDALHQTEKSGEIFQEHAKTLHTVLSNIETQTKQVDQTVKDTMENLNDNMESMSTYTGTFEEMAEKLRIQVSQSEMHLKDQHSEIINNLSDIAAHLDNSLESLRSQSGALGEHAQDIISDIINQTEHLSEHMNNIREKTVHTIQNIREMDETINQHFSTTDETAASLSHNWQKTAFLVENQCKDTLSKLDKLTEKMTEVEKENMTSADKVEEKVLKIIDQMHHASESIFMASASAVEAADETNRVIDEHTVKFQQLINALKLSNKSILIDAETIEQKNREKSGQHFSKIASKIMEQLHSLSIDINRYFEGDIPDKIWQSYIDGDKSSFQRRLKKLTDKKYASVIKEKYKSDPEFRKNALEYMQIFEEMMSQSMAPENYSAFSVALISSETGKIYLAIAQAVGRIAS
ncbi:MAG: hypothetical protein K9G26_02865 [Emcibacter sp.]|nr:hypothetical protein [Emcibacter sp.]